MAQATFRRRPVRESGWTRIEVSGDLDLATVPEFNRVLLTAIWTNPEGRLVIDLGAVTFLDCAGALPLVQARRALKDRFWLANIPRPVALVLDLAGLAASFAILVDAPATAATRVPRPSPEANPAPPLGLSPLTSFQEGAEGLTYREGAGPGKTA